MNLGKFKTELAQCSPAEMREILEYIQIESAHRETDWADLLIALKIWNLPITLQTAGGRSYQIELDRSEESGIIGTLNVFIREV